MLTFSIVLTPFVTEIPAKSTAMKCVSNGQRLSYNVIIGRKDLMTEQSVLKPSSQKETKLVKLTNT